MDVSFGEADLAALCNSSGMLTNRWGADRGRRIGRRLLELAAAADVTEVEALPGSHVQRGADGAVTITFHPEVIEVKAVLLDAPSSGEAGRGLKHERLRILDMRVHVIEGSRAR